MRLRLEEGLPATRVLAGVIDVHGNTEGGTKEDHGGQRSDAPRVNWTNSGPSEHSGLANHEDDEDAKQTQQKDLKH